DRVVVRKTATEASTNTHQVNGDVLLGNAERPGNQLAAGIRRLGRRPQFELAVLEMRGAILRFQRRMGKEWVGVSRLDDFGGVLQSALGVAIIAQCERGRLPRNFHGTSCEAFAA